MTSLQRDQRKALPEPRLVKRRILEYRESAHDAMAQFSRNPNRRHYNDWKENLLQWYMKTSTYISRFDSNENYSKLSTVKNWLAPNVNPEPEELMQLTKTLEDLVYDLGITDFGARPNTTKYGYSFLDGIAFNMDTSDAGFQRLLQNIKNMRRLMRDDVDFFGLIWGPNRTGKDTLALQLARTVKHGENTAGLEEKNIVVTPDQFWQSTQELDQYGVISISEMNRLFYSKDAMESEQKKRKKKLKQFATNNMFLIGCDTQFFGVDKEVISDKFKFAIHVPRRGRFEFYSKEKMQQFERDKETGRAVTPEPDFTGQFPKLEDEDWELYQDMEQDKIVQNEDGDEDGVDINRIAQEVKDKEDRYTKEHGGRTIVKKALVEADYGIGGRKSDQVKALVEEDLN